MGDGAKGGDGAQGDGRLSWWRRFKRKPERTPPPAEPPAEPNVPPDSLALIRLGKDGDGPAVNEFLRRYMPRLLRVVRIRMGPLLRRHIDPEDIVQEVCIIAVDKLPSFEADQRASILHWLTKISDHVISNKREMVLAQKRDPRKERRIASDDPSSVSQSGVLLRDRGPTPSQVYSRREQDELIDECVEALEPEAYRQIILMRDYCDADWDSICKELDRPTVDSARELHRRARTKLREAIGRYGIS